MSSSGSKSTDPPKSAAAVRVDGFSAASREKFADDCIAYIDTIQLSLDSALGTSGNLYPDSSVIDALGKLLNAFKDARETDLTELVEALLLMFLRTSDDDRSFNSAETLLVQEAVVAATLGVDAIAASQPMPDLVGDVNQRIGEAGTDSLLRVSGSSLLDVFADEATDRLESLYELFQRWRGSPSRSDKIPRDIRRVLHGLKGSASSTGLTRVAELIHSMETAVVNYASALSVVDKDFFAISLEAVESILDDIDRIRAGEQLSDHASSTEKLQRWCVSQKPIATGDGSQSNSGLPATSGSVVTESLLAPVILKDMEMVVGQADKEFAAVRQWHKKVLDQQDKYLQSLQTENSGQSSRLEMIETLRNHSDVQKSIGAALARLGSRLDALQQLTEVAGYGSLQTLKSRIESFCARLSVELNKIVDVQFVADRDEIPRPLLSSLIPSIEQLVQNSMVHGFQGLSEDGMKRRDTAGRLRVDITNSPQVVTIVVSDNGVGVNFAALRKVLEQQEGSNTASDQALLHSLINQGVSTRSSPELLSGRGVGLESVYTDVTALGGSLSLQTSKGGTSIEISLPKSVYWVEVYLVRSVSMLFAIRVNEVSSVTQHIEPASANLLSLARLLRMEEGPVLTDVVSEQETTSSVIAFNAGRSVLVDEVLDVKRVKVQIGNGYLRRLDGVSGSVLIEPDNLALLLDMEHWLRLASAIGHRSVPGVPLVLLVEDSATLRALMSRALSGIQCRCVFASDGEEASEMLKKVRPDIILLDIMLPKKDGFELAVEIREIGALDNVPVIFTTSLQKTMIEQLLSDTAPAGYLEKPYTAEELARLVAGLLQKTTS